MRANRCNARVWRLDLNAHGCRESLFAAGMAASCVWAEQVVWLYLFRLVLFCSETWWGVQIERFVRRPSKVVHGQTDPCCAGGASHHHHTQKSPETATRAPTSAVSYISKHPPTLPTLCAGCQHTLLTSFHACIDTDRKVRGLTTASFNAIKNDTSEIRLKLHCKSGPPAAIQKEQPTYYAAQGR